MKQINVTRAGKVGNKQPEEVKIKITGCVDEDMVWTQLRDVFDNDATVLAEALINTLPGGTLDRLVVKLLAHQISLYTVSYGQLQKDGE